MAFETMFAKGLTAPVRNVSTRSLIGGANGQVKFIIPHLTDDIPCLNLAPIFAAGSTVEKAYFSPDTDSIRGAQIHRIID